MYELLSLLCGFLIAVMLWLNGGLTQRYGAYSATVLIHLVGFSLIVLTLLLKREWPFKRRWHWSLYTGGALGVLIVVFANLAFERISVSALLALGLLGQSLAALLVDQFGLLQMPRKAFRAYKIWGLLFLAAGIAVMVESFEPAPLFFAFSSGAVVVLARTQNARLAAQTSVEISSFYNYLTGLLSALPLGLLLGRSEPFLGPLLPLAKAHYFFGGAVGLAVILLSNYIVSHISAFYFTLLTFVGQIGAGLIIDAFLQGRVPSRQFLGGLLVTLGLLLDLWLDRRCQKAPDATRPDLNSKPG